MTDLELHRINERAKRVFDHWPTLQEAFGCVDCAYLFRRAVDHVCPICGSQSVMDVAHFFNLARPDEEAEQQPDIALGPQPPAQFGCEKAESPGAVAKAAGNSDEGGDADGEEVEEQGRRRP